MVSARRLKRASEHVFYEISMFFYCVDMLRSLPEDQVSFNKNTLLEAFAIHLRNLLYFFYSSNRHKGDDMLAVDFLNELSLYKKSTTPITKLRYASKKVDKQIAHLTYHRNLYNKRTKPWHFGQIAQDLLPTVKAFYENLSSSRKRWTYFIELNKVITHYSSTK